MLNMKPTMQQGLKVPAEDHCLVPYSTLFPESFLTGKAEVMYETCSCRICSESAFRPGKVSLTTQGLVQKPESL